MEPVIGRSSGHDREWIELVKSPLMEEGLLGGVESFYLGFWSCVPPGLVAP